MNDIRHSFRLFAENTAADGTIIINSEIDGLNHLLKGLDRQVVTYGFDPSCNFYPENITYQSSGFAQFTIMHRRNKVVHTEQGETLPNF